MVITSTLESAKIVVTAISNKTDTIYLTDVQGEHFTANHNIVEYGAGKDTRAMLTNCTVASTQSTASVINGDLNTGNIFEVIQPNHAHHGINNKIEIIFCETINHFHAKGRSACSCNEIKLIFFDIIPTQ